MALGDEMGNDGFLPKSFTKPPEEAVTQDTGTATTEQNTEVAPTPQAQVEPQQPAKEVKVDAFIEDFNKRFGSQYKSEDEIKGLFGLPQKIADYETQLKTSTDYVRRIEELEKEKEESKNAGFSELLSKPLLRNAYVADQLLAKYPDKDPSVLQEIVMADVSKMSDIDVLVKEKKIDLPHLSEKDIREALLEQYGIDGESRPEEWSSIAKTKLAIAAQGARNNLKTLTSGIELPKTVSKEERDRLIAEQTAQRNKIIEPFKQQFLQFDKFKDERIPDLGEYDIPNDFKGKLGDMFQAIVSDAGLEPTEENLQAMMDLRNAMMVMENLPKIWEIAVKQGQTLAQQKINEKLANDEPPNTTTATDFKEQKQELPGKSLSQAFAEGKL